MIQIKHTMPQIGMQKSIGGGGYSKGSQNNTKISKGFIAFKSAARVFSLFVLLFCFILSGNVSAQEDVIEDLYVKSGNYDPSNNNQYPGIRINGVDYITTDNGVSAIAYKWVGSSKNDNLYSGTNANTVELLEIKSEVTIKVNSEDKKVPVTQVREFFGDKAGITGTNFGKSVPKVKKIIVPSSVIKIGTGAFTNKVGENYIGMSGLEELEIIGNSSLMIEKSLCQTSTFQQTEGNDSEKAEQSGKQELKNVTIGECLSFSSDAFNGQSNLAEVKINVNYLPKNTFLNCSSLKTADIILTATSTFSNGEEFQYMIMNTAFSGCTNLETLKVKASVVGIGTSSTQQLFPSPGMLKDCISSLKVLEIEGSILPDATLDENTKTGLYGQSNSSRTYLCSASSTSNMFSSSLSNGSYGVTPILTLDKLVIKNCVIPGGAFKQIHIKEAELSCCKIDGGAFNMQYVNCTSVTNHKPDAELYKMDKFVIDSLSILRPSALNYVYTKDFTITGASYVAKNAADENVIMYIENLTIGDGCNLADGSFKLDKSGFTDAHIKTITIGNNVTIGEDAFSDKPSLTSLTIGENCTFSAGVFKNCPNLTSITINSTKPPHFPEGSIDKAFDDLLLNAVLFTDAGKTTLSTENDTVKVNPEFKLTFHLPCPSGYKYKQVAPWKRLFDRATMKTELKQIFTENYSMNETEAENSAEHIVSVVHGAENSKMSERLLKINYDDNFFGNKVEYAEHVVLDDCGCPVDGNDDVIYRGDFYIKNGGSLAFKDLDKAKAHFLAGTTDEENPATHNIYLERELSYDEWHLLGYTNRIPDGTTYGQVLVTPQSHDFSALPFVANDWQRTKGATGDDIYAKASDELIKDQAFMVWPYNTAWDSENGKPATEEIDETPVITIKTAAVNLAEFSTTNSTDDGHAQGDFDFILTNTADKTVEADPTGETSGRWFPLYNPYIGRLDIKALLQNTNNASQIQGGYIYLYAPTSASTVSDWKAVNVSNVGTSDVGNVMFITPARGFMVASQGDAQNIKVKLNTSMIETEGNNEETEKNYNFKAGKDVSGIVFTSYANGTQTKAIARYNENSANGFDGNDAYIMLSTNKEDLVEPYFIVDNRMIFDNHFATLPYETEIRFHAAKQSNVDMTVTDIPENIGVVVIDMLAETETEITNGEKISFVAEEGENQGRYKVRFYNNGVGIQQAETVVADVRLLQNNRKITIFGEGLQNAEVINAIGQTVMAKQISGNEASLKLDGESGAYIIKVTTTNGTKTEKIVIK